MTIFLFTQWYPHKYDAMSGLFVRKHAEAIVAQGNDVHVFYVQCDDGQKKLEFVNGGDGRIVEHFAYLPSDVSVFSIFAAYHKMLCAVKIKPDIIHINVLSKVALVGYWVSRKWNVPYVVTEHWAGYLKENGTFKKNSIQAYFARFIAKRAECVMPVSSVLQCAMIDHGFYAKKWAIVSNVVEEIFYQGNSRYFDGKHKLLHVSCFNNKAKNIFGIIEAVNILIKRRCDFEMYIVGTGEDYKKAVEFSDNLELTDKYIHFVGEQTPKEVKQWFDKSDLFVLFSNYETACVVLQESLASTCPVVTTNVGIAISDINNDMGEKVIIGDVNDLSLKISLAMNNLNKYDRQKMREVSLKYNYENVGKLLQEVFEGAIINVNK